MLGKEKHLPSGARAQAHPPCLPGSQESVYTAAGQQLTQVLPCPACPVLPCPSAEAKLVTAASCIHRLNVHFKGQKSYFKS